MQLLPTIAAMTTNNNTNNIKPEMEHEMPKACQFEAF